MEKRYLGKTDIKLTSIGFGGAPLGNLFEELNETDCFLIDIRKLPQLTKEEYPYLDQCDEEKKIKIKAGKNKGKRNKKFYDL